MKLMHVTSNRSTPSAYGCTNPKFARLNGLNADGTPKGSAGGTGGGAPAPQTPPPEQQPQTAPGGGERTFTQSQLDGILAERIARDRRERPSNGQQPQAPARQQNETQGAPAADDGSWVFDVSDALEVVVAETNIRPTPAAKKMLREAYRNERPADSVGFVRSWFSALGIVPASSGSPAGNANLNTPPPNAGAPNGDAGKTGATGNAPPLSNLGPPSGGPREFESITDPNELRGDDIDRLKAQHGAEKAFGIIRAKVESWAQRTNLRVKPEKKR